MSETDLPEEREPKRESDNSTPPAPRSRMFKGGGPIQFFNDVKLEMKRVSWPTRSEVVSTTVICMIAVAFFGFYLWGVDRLLQLVFDGLEAWLRA